jgi:hypothetical protein
MEAGRSVENEENSVDSPGDAIGEFAVSILGSSAALFGLCCRWRISTGDEEM